MTFPVVSVVMAVRDCEKFVGAAVRSVLDQTFQDFELIVVDDQSVDSTCHVVRSFEDPRISVLAGLGAGSGSARNIGLRDACGKFIAFLDGDDIWDATHLAEAVSALAENDDVDVTFSLSRFIDSEGRPLRLPVRRCRGRFGFSDLLRDNVIGNGSSVAVRADAIPAGGFNDHLTGCIDYELWLRIAHRRPRNVLCISKILTSYRRHSGQISGDWRKMEREWRATMQVMRQLAPA
jgi:glycosyltransferase involved in cell wall biosynthesis